MITTIAQAALITSTLLSCQSGPFKICQIISLLCSKPSNYWQISHGLLSPSKFTRLFMFKLPHTSLISSPTMSLSQATAATQASLLFLKYYTSPGYFESLMPQALLIDILWLTFSLNSDLYANVTSLEKFVLTLQSKIAPLTTLSLFFPTLVVCGFLI